MYVEVIDGSIRQRNSNAKIAHLSEVQYLPCDHERYTSLFQYEESIINHFNLIGSVAGYKGNLYMERLWIDLDNEEHPELAKEQAIKLIKHIASNYGVPTDAFSIFFSGHKGYHIALHENLFGGFGSSDDLPKKIKRLAEMLCAGTDFVDLGIYNVNRAFRAINSCHPETGLFKIGITYDDLCGLDHAAICFMAGNPNDSYIFTTEMQPKQPIKALKDAWEYVSSVDMEIASVEIGDGQYSGESFFSSPMEGQRNQTLFKQAAMIFEQSQLVFSSVFDLIDAINHKSPNPLSRNEVYALVRSAENTIRRKVKYDESNRSWFTLAEQAGQVLDALEQKSGHYTMLFDEFDKIICGDLSGKLIIAAGQGGTKKSLWAQAFVTENLKRSRMRGVYNNQEMSKKQYLKRAVNMFPDGFRSKQLWQEWEEIRADRDVAIKGINDILSTDLAKRLIVDYKAGASPAYYRKMIEDVTKREGKVDMLIVDGLSMMDAKGTEKESAEAHTRELKYLANDLDIPVIVLVHVTKDVAKHTRDLIPHLRGSGKIYDNGDIFLSFSLCIDESQSSSDDIIYRTDIGYIRLFDKRESGETINVVYEFDPNTLKMVQHPLLRPSEVEVRFNK